MRRRKIEAIFKDVWRELEKRSENEVVVRTFNGSGMKDLKISQGATAGFVRMALYYLIHDLAVDLGVEVSEKGKRS